jgi:hypothetical protein
MPMSQAGMRTSMPLTAKGYRVIAKPLHSLSHGHGAASHRSLVDVGKSACWYSSWRPVLPGLFGPGVPSVATHTARKNPQSTNQR